MKLIDQCRQKVAQWPYGLLSVMAAVSSFGAYTCMYAFRKAFAAGTFSGLQYLHIDYKVWLVIAQVIGYTLSKFYGVKFISETPARLGDYSGASYLVTVDGNKTQLVVLAWNKFNIVLRGVSNSKIEGSDQLVFNALKTFELQHSAAK